MRLPLTAALLSLLLALGAPAGAQARGRKHRIKNLRGDDGDSSSNGLSGFASPLLGLLGGGSSSRSPSSSYRERFEREGYFVLPGLLTAAEVDAMASRVARYVRQKGPLLRTKAFGASGGWYAADIGSDPQLKPLVDAVHDKSALHAALSEVYGGERAYRFCGRAELNVDRGVGWHRDEPGEGCLLYTSPSPRDATLSRMPSSA